jgi:hypothetical protein
VQCQRNRGEEHEEYSPTMAGDSEQCGQQAERQKNLEEIGGEMQSRQERSRSEREEQRIKEDAVAVGAVGSHRPPGDRLSHGATTGIQ